MGAFTAYATHLETIRLSTAIVLVGPSAVLVGSSIGPISESILLAIPVVALALERPRHHHPLYCTHRCKADHLVETFYKIHLVIRSPLG